MVEPHDARMPVRRRRSDARRSIDAILEAARVVLSERPDASMEDVAASAGLTRQTVYAHFASRDALVVALVEAAAAEYASLLDGTGMDDRPATEALTAFLDAGWRLLDRYPLLLNPAARLPRPDEDPHDVVPPRLERVIRRGQNRGDLDASLPADWLAAAVLGLHHAAAAQITSGRMDAREAADLCLASVLRVCGARTESKLSPMDGIRLPSRSGF